MQTHHPQDEIVLAGDWAPLQKPPEYRRPRSTARITADVPQELAADERTRAQDIDVWTEAGVMHLTGVVRTEEVKQPAVEAAGRVAGVWEVEQSGPLSASAVATPVIEVICLCGRVTLRGQVGTAAEKAKVVALARSVPGVVAVIDELQIQADAWPKSSSAAPADAKRSYGG